MGFMPSTPTRRNSPRCPGPRRKDKNRQASRPRPPRASQAPKAMLARGRAATSLPRAKSRTGDVLSDSTSKRLARWEVVEREEGKWQSRYFLVPCLPLLDAASRPGTGDQSKGERMTYMQLRVGSQVPIRERGAVLVGGLDRDRAGPRGFQAKSLGRRWDARNRLELGLELADGPRGRDASLRSGDI